MGCAGLRRRQADGGVRSAFWFRLAGVRRSHCAEFVDQYELADQVAREMFGFAVEGGPGEFDKDEVVLHGSAGLSAHTPTITP